MLTDEPKWTTLPANVPAPIRRLLRRCLEKDRKRRFESAADARLEIEEALAPAPAEASVAGHHPPAWQKWSIATAVLVAVIASFAAGFASRRQQPASPMHFAIPVSGEVSQLAISSDGRSLAFVMLDEKTGKNVISVQAIGERHATPLAGTEDASYPFWSPDAAYVGFFADGKLMKVRSSGGAPQTIIAATRGARGASWGSKNVIVYSQRPAGPLWRAYWGAFAVSASGTVVTNPGSAVFESVLTWYDRRGTELGVVGRRAIVYNPSLSPDGQQLAADVVDPITSNLDIWTFDLRAGTSGRFTFGTLEESTPVWSPDGKRDRVRVGR